MFKNSKPIYIIIVYYALTVPKYSTVGEHCAHGEAETLELNTPRNSLFLFNRNALERNWEQNCHSYKDVHDKKPKRIWIVIHTEMCMTKTNTKIIRTVIHTEISTTKTYTQRNG